MIRRLARCCLPASRPAAIDAAAPGSTPWSYNATANLDFLGAGETITFSYTVTATDGSGATATDVVSFTITGTNDAPTVTATATRPGSPRRPMRRAQNLNQNGTVSFDDIDSNDVVDISFAPNGSPVWSHGSLDPAAWRAAARRLLDRR